MSDKMELLPCPFCASDNVRIAVTMHESWYYGECESCGGRTDFYDSQAEAIAAWNTRVDDYRQAAEYWKRMYEETFAERTCKVAACYDTADVDSCGSNAEWYFAFTCGDELYWDEPEPPNYCPNCGAKVVGE